MDDPVALAWDGRWMGVLMLRSAPELQKCHEMIFSGVIAIDASDPGPRGLSDWGNRATRRTRYFCQVAAHVATASGLPVSGQLRARAFSAAALDPHLVT